ncbi:hypothetical protein C8R43DRAFT_1014012 [Mycena crocata]|nr:hypothetical protein C8R43DRAFT_1014012 [Mycena crocata]
MFKLSDKLNHRLDYSSAIAHRSKGKRVLPQDSAQRRTDSPVVLGHEKSNYEDDAKVSPAAYNLNLPILFVAFNADYIGLPMFGDGTHAQYVKGTLTRKEVPGDHWAVMSHALELNEILLE